MSLLKHFPLSNINSDVMGEKEAVKVPECYSGSPSLGQPIYTTSMER